MTEIALNTSIALVAFRNMWFCFTSHTLPSSGNIQGLSQACFYRLGTGSRWDSSGEARLQSRVTLCGPVLGLCWCFSCRVSRTVGSSRTLSVVLKWWGEREAERDTKVYFHWICVCSVTSPSRQLSL